MQTISKVFVCIVFACLFLSWMGSVGRPLHRAHLLSRSGQERRRVCARLRRCRGDNPVHHPVRPSKNAVLPPDDDDNDGPERPNAKVGHERLPSLGQGPTCRPNSLTFGSRPLPTEVPRHQTLCILLI
jgi:hypothetical protein